MEADSRQSSQSTKTVSQRMADFSQFVTQKAGSSGAFTVALGIIVVWGLTGPIFHFSDTWQLVINTGTTIVTFLMVFLIQRSQNKDSLAIQIKLNELVAAVEGASNRMIDVEDMTEEELLTLEKHYRTLARMAASEESITSSHSIEEAENRHELKRRRNDG